MSQEHLLLDPSIRDWVVIPMVVMMVLVALGRNYVSQLIKSTPSVTESDLDELRHKQVLQQSLRLRINGRCLNDSAFNMRKSYMIRKKTGVLREKVPGPSNPMSNPMAMIDMMKGNIVFMLPNFAMMAFIGYFFAGFVCLKIPFPLPSNHFKLMLQRGVDLSSLDVSYVSSLSWYFLVTFGLNGVMRLIMGGGDEFDDAKMMQMQMGMGMGGGGPGQMGFDANNAYKNEREALGIAKHEFIGDWAEQQLLGDRYPEKDETAAEEIDLSNFSSS
eukprot:CAMPEP_0174953960 /NCGR_PEP_ID=MMETSP0004_2-20121128/159_1 /TAXON_ID=420556 /ORGANISM="Ochromonas sp., Strain CCMP1393" /LENGTH=272 /DNA_ID=CAMNT_0016201721 /DNA_START=33 /DNA_END=851 /DNA_ORIENTATION=+